MYVNVTDVDAITIESCNWIDFISVAYMLDDATEGVAEHSARLQPSINLHAPVTAFMFSCSGTHMYYPGGMKARVSMYMAIFKKIY